MFRSRKGKELFSFEQIITKTRGLSVRTCDLITLFGGAYLLRQRHVTRTLRCTFYLMHDGGLTINRLKFFHFVHSFSKIYQNGSLGSARDIPGHLG